MGQSGQEKTEQPTAKKEAGCQKRRKYLPKQGCSYRIDPGWHIFRDPHMASFYIRTAENLYDLGHRWSSPVLRRYAFSQPCFCYTVCVFKMCASLLLLALYLELWRMEYRHVLMYPLNPYVQNGTGLILFQV